MDVKDTGQLIESPQLRRLMVPELAYPALWSWERKESKQYRCTYLVLHICLLLGRPLKPS